MEEGKGGGGGVCLGRMLMSSLRRLVGRVDTSRSRRSTALPPLSGSGLTWCTAEKLFWWKKDARSTREGTLPLLRIDLASFHALQAATCRGAKLNQLALQS